MSTFKRQVPKMGYFPSTNTKPVMRKGVATTRRYLTVPLGRRLVVVLVLRGAVLQGRRRGRPLRAAQSFALSFGRTKPPRSRTLTDLRFLHFFPLRPCEVSNTNTRGAGGPGWAWSRSEINLLLYLHTVQ
jgi:hypothetical protein